MKKKKVYCDDNDDDSKGDNDNVNKTGYCRK